MPRNGSGTYTLPQAAFTPGTTISSSAVNSDFSDIATALTDSIATDGQTPITAPLKQANGSLANPSWTFNNDTSAGLYLAAVGIVGLVAGSFGLQVNSTGVNVTAAAVASGGTNYAVGDTVTLTGGTALRQPVLTVATISGSAIASVTVADAGLYITAPGNPVSQGSSSGSGTGATFNLTTTAADAISSAAGGTLWQALGATSYMAGAMIEKDGTGLAGYIGASALSNAIQASLAPLAQGYLTPQNGTAIITGDVSSTSIYYTPYTGPFVPVYNGTNYVATAFTQLQLILDAVGHVSDTIYDVFVFLNSGVLTIGSGPAWTTSTAGSGARGVGAGTTQIQLQNGIYVNSNTINLRNNSVTFSNVAAGHATYLGSFYTDSTAGQVTCHRSIGQNRKWGIFNAFNRQPIIVQAADPTSAWINNSPGNRASNNAPAAYSQNTFNVGSGTAANGISVLCGLAEEVVISEFDQTIAFGSNGSQTTLLVQPIIAIGLNSITVTSGMRGLTGVGWGLGAGLNMTINGNVSARLVQPPALGVNIYTCIENSSANTNSSTQYQGSADMQLLCKWLG